MYVWEAWWSHVHMTEGPQGGQRQGMLLELDLLNSFLQDGHLDEWNLVTTPLITFLAVFHLLLLLSLRDRHLKIELRPVVHIAGVECSLFTAENKVRLPSNVFLKVQSECESV